MGFVAVGAINLLRSGSTAYARSVLPLVTHGRTGKGGGGELKRIETMLITVADITILLREEEEGVF